MEAETHAGDPPARSGRYDSAALDYREASDRFWGFLSLRTIERMHLQSGQEVLDAACGPGVSAVAAAEQVGSTGRVLGLDSSEQMLRMTVERANAKNLGNVEVQMGDMARLDYPPESFDAVVSVLGIFFVPDMPALVSALWRLIRPGGQLAITTLGRDAFEPALGIWKEAVRRERPDAPLAFSWERTNDPEGLRALLGSSGVVSPTIELESNSVALTGPEDWWLAVTGSGMRRTLLEMDEQAAGRVKQRCESALQEADIQAVQLPAIYALATKS